MSKLLSQSLLVAMALSGATAVRAFSLLGPFEAWQTGQAGYNPGGNALTVDQFGDTGAPKGIGGEYRHVEPILAYGFDGSFIDYFGDDGVRAIEAAIKVFNDLPAVSSFSPDLAEFPLASSRVNFAAQRLGLVDVKSVAMGFLMERLGLASPERFVWTIRGLNFDPNGAPLFLNVRRSYDPVTYLASSFVNNTLYTYYNRPFFNPDGSVLYYDANEVALDAAEPNVSLAAYMGTQVSTIDGRVQQRINRNSFGLYYTGLTRDDAGGYRYMYSPDNKNYQPLPGGTTLKTSQNVTVIGTGGGGGWGGLTPAIGVATGGGTGGTTNTVAAPIDLGIRAGVNKITFVRVDTDPLLNRYLKPLVLRYTDSVTTNGVTRIQQLERSVTLPSFMFVANDIGTWPSPNSPFPWVYARGAAQFISSPQPPNVVVGLKDPNAGPGILDYGDGAGGSLIPLLVFNTIGPGLLNNLGRNTEETGFSTFVWGSFDGTTNAPVVYPKGQVTLDEIARAISGGN